MKSESDFSNINKTPKIIDDIKINKSEINEYNKNILTDRPKLVKRLKFKKRKEISTTKYISHINLDSFFIFDFKNPETYFENISNKNLLKLSKNEYLLLKQKIIDLQKLKNQKFPGEPSQSDFIELDRNQIIDINNYFNVPTKENEIVKFVKTKLEQNFNLDKISCRKLSNLYYKETGKSISKTYINNILKNKLKLSYLKSTIKTSKINSDIGLISSFCFIKSIAKCLHLGYKLFFLDESSILSYNNNYRAWRAPNQNIYFNMGTKSKRNLILIVSDSKVIYFKITQTNTDEKNFLEFMKEFEENYTKNNSDKFVVIMDNLSSHRTKNLLTFYKEKKINVIFNSPYMSNFNAVEFAFRAIKLKIYNHLYESIDDTISDVVKILKNKNFENVLIHNYIETIKGYLDFYEINKFKNLNNIEI